MGLLDRTKKSGVTIVNPDAVPVPSLNPEAPDPGILQQWRDRAANAESDKQSVSEIEEEAFVLETKQRLAFYIFLARQVSYFALLLCIALLSSVKSQRLVLMAGLFVLLAPFGAITYVRLKKSGDLPTFLPWADAIVNVAMVAFAPALFPYVLVLSLVQLTLGVMAYGVAASCISAAILVVGYPLSALITGRGGDVDSVLLTMFGLFIPGVAVLTSRIRKVESDTRRKYMDLLGGLDAVVWEADPVTRDMNFMSPLVRKLLGYEPEDMLANWKSYVHPDDLERERSSFWSGVELGEPSFAIEFRMINCTNDTIFIRNNISVERNEAGTVKRIRGIMVDITRQQEAEAMIRKQAQYDGLTGLPNRSLFNEQLRRRLEDARRSGEGLSVLLLDLNGFKEVNDTLGHAVGDQLLQAIAGRLAAYLPDRSFVARLGGDEFAVLVYPASPRSAAHVAETIASCLQPPITVDEMTIQAAASTGIAVFPADGDSGAALLRRADAAMYEAKQSGRSHMFATPDDDAANVRRLQLMGELRASINMGDFRLFHQPKVDLQTGHIVGTEALIRWNHRQFGLLAPVDFIELTEVSGLIQPLTRWIIEQGVKDLATWRAAGYELAVALNLSVRNFFDQGLPAFIAQLLSEHNVPGDQLVLEITEREVMADRNLARSALAAFRSLGVKISIDDFGTGFSSLSQLQQLPIDEVKIDQSFVAGMVTNPQDAVIVRSIIDLGHNLGLEVVAEGAEDGEQLGALRDLGADRVQGYVISKPLPFKEFHDWIDTLERTPVGNGSNLYKVRSSHPLFTSIGTGTVAPPRGRAAIEVSGGPSTGVDQSTVMRLRALAEASNSGNSAMAAELVPAMAGHPAAASVPSGIRIGSSAPMSAPPAPPAQPAPLAPAFAAAAPAPAFASAPNSTPNQSYSGPQLAAYATASTQPAHGFASPGSHGSAPLSASSGAAEVRETAPTYGVASPFGSNASGGTTGQPGSGMFGTFVASQTPSANAAPALQPALETDFAAPTARPRDVQPVAPSFGNDPFGNPPGDSTPAPFAFGESAFGSFASGSAASAQAGPENRAEAGLPADWRTLLGK